MDASSAQLGSRKVKNSLSVLSFQPELRCRMGTRSDEHPETGLVG